MSEEVSEEELVKRRAYLEDLKSYLTEQQEKISLSLERLGWTPEHFIKPQNRVSCPFDRGHVIPKESLEKHIEKCELLKRGVPPYQLKDVLDEAKRLENIPTTTVKLDEAALNSVLWNNAVECGQVYTGQRKLPITHEDEKIILSPHERLAVHDYVVSEAKSNSLMLNIEKDENLTTDWEKIIKKGVLESENKDSMTTIEKLAAIRDFKRRRQNYRAKNVHITRKSYTEIIHEVIGNQMEMWEAEIKEESMDTERMKEDTDSKKGDSDIRKDVQYTEQMFEMEKHRSSTRENYSDRERDREGRSDRERDREGRSDRERDREGRGDRERDREGRGDRERDREGRSEGGSDRERSSYRDRYDERGSVRDKYSERSSDRERYIERGSDRDKYKERGSNRDRSRDFDRSIKRDSRSHSKDRGRHRYDNRDRSRKERKRSRSESAPSDVNPIEVEATPMILKVENESRTRVRRFQEEKPEEETKDRSREEKRHSGHKKHKKHKHKHKRQKHTSLSPDSESSTSVK